MFDSKNMYHYLFAFSLIMTASYVGNSFKQNFSERTSDEYELIKKYLLNDSPLYGFNKPKIWIHSKYEVNARAWNSRNSTDLNQPYLHLTIQSVVDHCGDDFHVCLIDDNTFSNLIPGWDTDVGNLPEPLKTNARKIGFATLLYLYGGVVMPNSFVCSKSLKSIFDDGTSGSGPFVCEAINRTDIKPKRAFVPDMCFMGALKNNETMMKLIEQLKKSNQYSYEREFVGSENQWLSQAISDHKINIVNGNRIGIKTKSGKPILLEDLMEDKFLDLSADCSGVYIPGDEVLRRTKYQWLANISRRELLDESHAAIVKYMKASMVDEYSKSSIIPSVVAL